MKKWIMSLLVVAMFAPALFAAEGGLRYTVTVTKFENDAGWRAQWDIGDAWAAVLTDALNQTDRFIVLGETDMRQAAMDEQDFAASGRTASGKKAPETGQMTPAQILVKGTITHVEENTSGGGGGISVRGIRLGGRGSQAEINTTIYMVDSTTGQVLASESVTGEAGARGFRIGYCCRHFSGDVEAFKKDNVGKAVMASVEEAVDWMIGQLEDVKWTGTVVMNRDGRIYINRGERDGLMPGDVLDVYQTGDTVEDRFSGGFLSSSVKLPDEQAGTVMMFKVYDR
ncbi:MAG: CsgG/HfaB family protein, partial [Thermoanaerobaculia bacterium]|nr:CsgG/HfaB family protein [Thermoanaerobaculia bacterium]